MIHKHVIPLPESKIERELRLTFRYGQALGALCRKPKRARTPANFREVAKLAELSGAQSDAAKLRRKAQELEALEQRVERSR
jgi:hypothetical protein